MKQHAVTSTSEVHSWTCSASGTKDTSIIHWDVLWNISSVQLNFIHIALIHNSHLKVLYIVMLNSTVLKRNPLWNI